MTTYHTSNENIRISIETSGTVPEFVLCTLNNKIFDKSKHCWTKRIVRSIPGIYSPGENLVYINDGKKWTPSKKFAITNHFHDIIPPWATKSMMKKLFKLIPQPDRA